MSATRRGLLVLLMAAWHMTTAPDLHAQVSAYGIDRASPSDVMHLANDIATVINAERLLNGRSESGAPPSAQDLAQQLAIERQREMLGLDSEVNAPDLATSVRDWWAKHVVKPAVDIANNPAASCALARDMMKRILNIEKQAQIMGLVDSFGPFGNSASELGQVLKGANERCLEDAFDECMATGSGQTLLMMLTEGGRQMRLLDIESTDFEDRVAYLLRRCTVYKVMYHMELRDLALGGSAVLDGSYILLLHLPDGGDAVSRVVRGQWATRPQDPRDVQLTSLTCSAGATCRQSTPFMSGESCGIIMRRRNAVERTFTVEPLDVNANPPPSPSEMKSGTRVVIHTERHQEGENRLVLQFLPPQFLTEEKQPEERQYMPGGANAAIFDEAVNAGDDPRAEGAPCPLAPLLVNNDTWVEGTYPTLFKTAHSATTGDAQETTHFDIVHRPDLFPANEIVAEWEVHRQQPEPTRQPLRPPPHQ